jgi:DNA-binding IclR family transcriptional regulator
VDRFLEELDQVLDQDYALDREEGEIGVCCALSISGFSVRLTHERQLHLVPEMKRVAKAFADVVQSVTS